MFTIFVIIKKLIKFLNSNESISNIAFSSTLALIFALLPFNAILHFIGIIGLIVFNGNFFVFLFFTPIFELFSNVFYPFFDHLGNWFLTIQSFQSVYKSIYELPFINLIDWNNSIMMGGLLFSIIIAIPVYYLHKVSLTKYRKLIMPIIERSKLRHIFKFPSWLGRFK
ncbi:MAG: TIGR03546 family protein [Candidatus Marinamargulisbacteria bacterium]